MSLDDHRAYVAARDLTDHGIPVFTFPEGKPPRRWQHTPARTPEWLPGDALAMVTGHGLDGIDLDPRNGADPWAEVARMTALGVVIVGIVTTPGGGLHVYVPSTGYACTANTTTGVDYRGAGGFLYLPGTRRAKYDGKGYGWHTPITWEALDLTPGSLDDHRHAVAAYLAAVGSTARTKVLSIDHFRRSPTTAKPAKVPKAVTVGPRTALPRSMKAALAGYYRGDRTRSGRFHHAVWAAAALGWTPDRITTALTPYCLDTGLYPGRVADEVTRSLSKRTGTPPPRPPRGDDNLDQITAAATTAAWTGQAAHTDRRVLAHLLQLANRLGRTEITEARSTIAAALALDPQTVTAALRRLTRAGWITRTQAPTARTAAGYRLGTPEGLSVTERGKPDTPPTGTTREIVLAASQGATVREIATATGLAVITVKRLLLTLEAEGAVTASRTPGAATVWTAPSTVDTRQVARREAVTARVIALRASWHRGVCRVSPPDPTAPLTGRTAA